jgi:hypothetical protein
MRQKAWILFLCLTGVTTGGLAQELDAFHIDRGSIYLQPTPDMIELVGTLVQGAPSWFFSGGASFSEGTVAGAWLAGPGFPQGFPMEAEFSDDGLDYKFETTFMTEEELRVFAPEGIYTFTGHGSGIGPFTETVFMDVFAPLSPKRITNLAALQAIDPALPFVIEWEPFTDQGEVMAVIEVDIMAHWDWGSQEIWESPEEEGSFGLDPASTSVEVPAGVLAGHGLASFEVVVLFTRIDDLVMETVFGSGLKGYVTVTHTIAQIHLQAPEGHVELEPTAWLEDECFGWLYGFSPEWGYSYDLGYVWVGQTPGYLYQYPMGWLAYGGGTMKTGCWLYSPAAGWMFTLEGYGGWYQSLDGSWHNMINP